MDAPKKINFWYSLTAPIYDFNMLTDEVWGGRKRLIDHLRISPEKKVLEVACGTGKNFRHYPIDSHYLALDINRNMLGVAKHRTNRHELMQGDATALPIPDDSLDVVILTYALSGCPDNKGMLNEAYRVLKPGGRLGILDFEHQVDRFTGCAKMDLAELVSGSGMKIHYERREQPVMWMPVINSGYQHMYVLRK